MPFTSQEHFKKSPFSCHFKSLKRIDEHNTLFQPNTIKWNSLSISLGPHSSTFQHILWILLSTRKLFLLFLSFVTLLSLSFHLVHKARTTLQQILRYLSLHFFTLWCSDLFGFLLFIWIFNLLILVLITVWIQIVKVVIGMLMYCGLNRVGSNWSRNHNYVTIWKFPKWWI